MPESPQIIVRRLRIYGRVQGVAYRYSAQKQALALGVTGWVRNRTDGSVEALVSGNSLQVEKMIAWSRVGPPAARVDRVDIEDEASVRMEIFEIWPTL